MPLAPPCIEGPVDTLCARLVEAFDAACASSTRPMQFLEAKRQSIDGLGLQIRNLGLFVEGEGPVSRLHSGMEPLGWSNVSKADFSHLRSRHALEAVECVFMISCIFMSVGYVPEPYMPSYYPVSFIPYSIAPRPAEGTVDRTSVPDLAHRAMRFRDYKTHFKFSASISDPNASGVESTAYWSNCAGLPGKAIVSNVSALVLKLVWCHKLSKNQVWLSECASLDLSNLSPVEVSILVDGNDAIRGVGRPSLIFCSDANIAGASVPSNSSEQ